MSVLDGFLGYIDGSEIDRLVFSGDEVTQSGLILLGVFAASASIFLGARLAAAVLKALTPPKAEPPAWLRRIGSAIAFAFPPPPKPGPDGRHPLSRFGIAVSAFVHCVPPPGPHLLRVVVDAALGASPMPVWKFVLGAAIGFLAHVSVLALLARQGLQPPDPPDSLAALLPPLAVLVLVTITVRLIAMKRK